MNLNVDALRPLRAHTSHHTPHTAQHTTHTTHHTQHTTHHTPRKGRYNICICLFGVRVLLSFTCFLDRACTCLSVQPHLSELVPWVLTTNQPTTTNKPRQQQTKSHAKSIVNIKSKQQATTLSQFPTKTVSSANNKSTRSLFSEISAVLKGTYKCIYTCNALYKSYV